MSMIFYLSQLKKNKRTRVNFRNWFDHEKIKMLKFLFKLVKIYSKTREHNNSRETAAERSIVTKSRKLKNVKNV